MNERKKIKLVVIASEDEAVTENIRRLIAKYDYSIIIVESAIKSILNILEREVDLLILDLAFLKNMQLDLIKIIKKMRPRLPIVILLEDFTFKTIRKYTEAGVFYIAMKPVQTDEIENVIKAIIRYHNKKLDNVGSLI